MAALSLPKKKSGHTGCMEDQIYEKVQDEVKSYA
jgi:hypothetical protein